MKGKKPVSLIRLTLFLEGPYFPAKESNSPRQTSMDCLSTSLRFFVVIAFSDRPTS